MQDIIILLIVLLSCLAAYGMHIGLKKIIDPKRSLVHLFTFMAAHVGGIFIILFLLNYLLLKYRFWLFNV